MRPLLTLPKPPSKTQVVVERILIMSVKADISDVAAFRNYGLIGAIRRFNSIPSEALTLTALCRH